MNRIVIVGASAGGLAAADALRRRGYAGAIALIGDEPQQPYDRPPLSKAYGYLRDHDEALVLDSDLSRRLLLVAYRKDDRLTGVLAAGMPPKTLRAWRALIAAGATWEAAVTEAAAA